MYLALSGLWPYTPHLSGTLYNLSVYQDQKQITEQKNVIFKSLFYNITAELGCEQAPGDDGKKIRPIGSWFNEHWSESYGSNITERNNI